MSYYAQFYVQILANGLLLGGLYVIVALGFSLVWGVMNIINLAHGAFIMLGAYVTFWLFHLWGLDPFLSLPVSMAALFALGYLVQRYVINYVVTAQIFMLLILTFGLDIFIVNLVIAAWTADFRSVTPAYSGRSWQYGLVSIAYIRLAIVALALLLTGALALFLRRTKLGRAIQATSLDREAAQLVGINTRAIYAITFGIGAALAGAAGSLVATTYTISPTMGGSLTLKAFVICILGGLGSISGVILGGLVLGVAESVGAIVIGPGYQDAVSFLLLVVILIVRPAGLFGRKFFAEVRH